MRKKNTQNAEFNGDLGILGSTYVGKKKINCRMSFRDYFGSC